MFFILLKRTVWISAVIGWNDSSNFILFITAPLHVQVLDITHSSASVCWEEPLHGDVLGYTISYRSDSHVAKTVNVTVDYDVDVCHSLSMLDDDTEYTVQVHGWNEYEIGQLSQLVDFKTAKNCKYLFLRVFHVLISVFISFHFVIRERFRNF